MVGDSIDYSYWNKDKVITTMHKMTHQKVYATDKWKAGDFNSVNEDHNYFWQYQDGTVGKATGIMSEEDEQSFIESTFELYKKYKVNGGSL